MIDPAVAFRKLAVIPTEEELADFLHDENVTGNRGDTEECPLANWLRRQCGHVFHVDGTVVFAKAPYDVDDPRFRDWSWSPTDAMYHFVTHFDDGYYPALDSGAAPDPCCQP